MPRRPIHSGAGEVGVMIELLQRFRLRRRQPWATLAQCQAFQFRRRSMQLTDGGHKLVELRLDAPLLNQELGCRDVPGASGQPRCQRFVLEGQQSVVQGSSQGFGLAELTIERPRHSLSSDVHSRSLSRSRVRIKQDGGDQPSQHEQPWRMQAQGRESPLSLHWHRMA
jgi:hypothetical protein